MEIPGSQPLSLLHILRKKECLVPCHNFIVSNFTEKKKKKTKPHKLRSIETVENGGKNSKPVLINLFGPYVVKRRCWQVALTALLSIAVRVPKPSLPCWAWKTLVRAAVSHMRELRTA